MKYFLFLALLCTTFFACKQESPQVILNGLEVRFIDSPCCGNLETLDGEMIDSEFHGYENDLLAAVNIADFASENIQLGDELVIEFAYSNLDFPCSSICNKMEGLRIEITSLERKK